ncbi:hypothetical protein [Nocardia altamirensis]|uniref:hypothetical protein n=1 Tax=Nocardia altamirensis TaxID=472158 RepID=UPI00083FF332|nr:hypothetical protein [Nocardia altamirensis]
MVRTGRLSALAAIIATSAIMTGCATATTDPPAGPADPSYPAQSADASPDVVVAVRIAGGAVTPANTRAEAEVGQPIVLRVDSDVADELHVHAEPARTFTVEPKSGQEFRFVVSVPGRVEVELHNAGTTVVTVLIRP